MAITRSTNELQRHVSRVIGRTPTNPELDDWVGRAARSSGEGMERDQILSSLQPGLGDAFSQVIRNTMTAGGAAIRFNWLTLKDITSAKGTAFIIPQIQRSYRSWVRRQKKIWDDPKTRPAGFRTFKEFSSPLEFARRVTKGRARVLLDALLGPAMQVQQGKYSRRSYRVMKMWRSVDHSRVARQASATYLQDAVDIFTDDARLRSLVEEVVRERGAAAARRVTPDWDFLEDVPANFDIAAEVDAQIVFIKNYLARHIAGGGITAWTDPAPALTGLNTAHVRRMLGRRPRDPHEVVHRIMEARDVIDGAARILGNEGGVPDFWALEGIEAMIDAGVRRAGYEKGFVFELEIIDELLQGGIERLIIQAPIAGLPGPDFVVLIRHADGRVTAHLLQAKSYDDYRLLIGGFDQSGDLTSIRGETIRQFGSDLRRLMDDSDTAMDPNAPLTIQLRQADGSLRREVVDPDYAFYFDEARLRDGLRPETPEQFEQAIEEMDEARRRIGVFIDETNAYLRGDVLARDYDRAVSRILNGAEEGIELGRRIEDPATGELLELQTVTIRDILQNQIDEAAARGSPLSVRELFAMRLAVDPRTGYLDLDLVDKLLAMEPPFQLSVQMHQAESFVM